ncbi:MAG TPA: bifunctional precorrin-2 dehydrogenase/sirohydrochlorin ferrochelatase [Sphingomonas sp.]|nr:bifunctional precorrin-2 dehydrogenase/sirohydrochlorin ferrochelatase [Sphingomonas sp.]
MHSLPVFLRLEGRPVILLGEGEVAEAKRRLLVRAGAHIVGEKEQAVLAIVAIEEDGAAEAAVARLAARGILVNAVDRPALCDFTLPAIVDRDPVLVAIGTGGASAGLAKALRQRLEAMLPADLGGLARALHGARAAIRARFPDAAERRRAIDAVLDPGGPLDPFAASSGNAVAQWLEGATPPPPPSMTVTIRLRSADPDDLSLAEARWLGRADTLYHDGHVPAAILRRARADATCIAEIPPLPPARAGITIVVHMADSPDPAGI